MKRRRFCKGYGDKKRGDIGRVGKVRCLVYEAFKAGIEKAGIIKDCTVF